MICAKHTKISPPTAGKISELEKEEKIADNFQRVCTKQENGS
jgi:hypothetical protein